METEVATMTKRVRTLEEDYDGTETKLHQTSAKLDEATKAADESERFGVRAMFLIHFVLCSVCRNNILVYLSQCVKKRI